MNNIRNKPVSKKDIESVVNSFTGPDITVKINNVKKFQKAFIHKSFCIVDSDNSDSDNYSNMFFEKKDIYSNERLEFLGDKVIDLITTEFLFDNFPDKDEGFLTKLKSRIVKKESLSFLGEKLGFKNFLMLSSHVERISGRDNPRFLEDTMESFMGILYKDQNSNLSICKAFLLGVYSRFIDLDELITNNDNYKDSLLRYFHSKNWGHPEYVCEETDKKDFSCFVKINDKISHEVDSVVLTKLGETCSRGKTKKNSQQECSKKWLLALKVSLNY